MGRPRGPGPAPPWDARSLAQPYSVSKPFAAVCALRLAEAGQLDLDAPSPGTGRGSAPGHRAAPARAPGRSGGPGPAVPTAAFYDWDHLCGRSPRRSRCGRLARPRRVGAVLRAPGRRTGTAGGRAQPRPLPARGSLRADRAGLRIRARPRRSGAGGRPYRLDEHSGKNASGRPRPLPRAIANPPGVQDPAVVNGAACAPRRCPR